MAERIATTQWSLVLAARDGSETEARQALEDLCQTYWRPLYAYVRRQGADVESAKDLTQAYFLELLQRDLLARVDPAKGRFRAFLLASMRNFLSRRRQHNQALKRGGGVTTLSLDFAEVEASYALHAGDEMSPDALFEYSWAATTLGLAMERLQRHAVSVGSERQFEQLKQYLTSSDLQIPYRDSAAALDISEDAVKSAVQRLRRRLGRYLREEIARTVANPSDVDDEVRHLLTTLRN